MEFVDQFPMLCPKCEEDLEKDSQFCIHCGYKIASAGEREELRAEQAERRPREMAASGPQTTERAPAQMEPEESGGGRGAGVGLIIGGIVWMVIFFVLNYAVFSFGIHTWLGGLIGAFWGLIFLGFMLGGLFFIFVGILAIITGKVYIIK